MEIKYGDRVYIKAGFYKGTFGYVIEEKKERGGTVYKIELSKYFNNKNNYVTLGVGSELLEKPKE